MTFFLEIVVICSINFRRIIYSLIIKNENFEKKNKMENNNIKEENKIKRTHRINPYLSQKSYSLNKPGKILLAKRHSSANRPLHKINHFTSKVKFCNCCNLPQETKGIIERFSYWDSIEKFAECGIGTYLYFYYFQYAILILTIALFMSSIPTLILNEHYTRGLNNICNNYYDKYDNVDLYPKCKKYVSHEKGSGYYNNETDWVLRYSSDNIKNYRLVFKEFTNNKDVDNVLVNYSLLHFFTLITLFVVNIVYIILIKTKGDQVNLMNTTPKDYTLLCSNLYNAIDSFNKYKNFSLFDDEEIKDKNEIEKFIFFLQKVILPKNNEDLNIEEINICYKLNKFMTIQGKINNINENIFLINHHPSQIRKNEKDNKKKLEEMNYYKGYLCCKRKIPYIKLEEKRKKYEDQLELLFKEKMMTSKENFAGCIFITFPTIKEKENYYNKFPHSFFEKSIVFIKELKYRICWCCLYKETLENFHRRKKLKVSFAPDPEDLIWENMEFTLISKIKRISIIYIISLLLIGVSFGIILYLNYLQQSSELHDWEINTFMKFGISLVITGVINGLNFLFFLLLDYLTTLERQRTKTDYYLSYSVKLTIFTFINTGVIPLFSNYMQNGWGENDNLLNNTLMIFLINSTVTPLMWTFNIGYIIKKIRIYFIEKNYPVKSLNISQKELNQIYELPNMDISAKYSYIAKTILMTFLYIPIFPLGVPISLLGFILGYLLERYNFTHIYKRPEMINESICFFYISNFNIFLFCFSIGIWMFMSENFRTPIWSLIDIILFGVLCIIPYRIILKYNFLGITEAEINQKKYKDVYFEFFNDYERQNPMTKKTGLKKYLTKLRDERKISKEIYEIGIENIENLNLLQMYYKDSKNNFSKNKTAYYPNINKSNKEKNETNEKIEKYLEKYQKIRSEAITKYDVQILQAFGRELTNKDNNSEEKSKNEFEVNDDSNEHNQVYNSNNPFLRNLNLGDYIYENYRIENDLKEFEENSLEIEMKNQDNNTINNDNDYNNNNLEIIDSVTNNSFSNDNYNKEDDEPIPNFICLSLTPILFEKEKNKVENK